LWTVCKSKEYTPEELKAHDPGAWDDASQGTQSNTATLLRDLVDMPKTMVQLAFVQFFTWFALFAMWIYTTSAVTRHIYHATDTASALYNEGANWVGICFAIYNGCSALFAFALPWLAKRTNRKITHMICLSVGGLSLVSIYFIHTPELLILPMAGIGLAWSSILSMPYAILACALPANKMGFYMGVFNFFIVIPQILAASILGLFTKNLFNGDAICTLVLGGCSMFVAAALVMFVTDKNT
jgi:maltose/moltooligosaccharide transporter